MRSKILAAVLAVPLVATTLACGGTPKDPRGPGVTDKQTGKSERIVVFEVAGTAASASNITYGLGGNMSQDNGQKLPWSKQAKSTDAFLFTSLSAQSAGGSGTITCKVTVDGKLVAENTSQGQYAVVTCSGSK